MKRHLILSCAAALLLSLASCGGARNENRAGHDAGTHSTDVSVSAVELGRGVDAEKRVTERVEVFGPRDVIYASVVTNGTAADAKLKARWIYEDGQVVEETEQTISPQGAAATEFHVAKPDGWPAGKYRLEVFLNGTQVESRTFEVKST